MSFGAPLVLLALAALPLFYLLLRLLPPLPVRQPFPALRLLRDLATPPPPPRTPPWWLVLLRLGAVAAFILALAHPTYDGAAPTLGNGAVVIVVDNGWSAAPTWPQIQAEAQIWIARAADSNRSIVLAPTADAVTPTRASAALAREHLSALQPRPWPGDPARTLGAVTAFDSAAVLWLSDGVATEEALDAALAETAALHNVRVYLPAREHLPLLMTGVTPVEGGLAVELKRLATTAERMVPVEAVDTAGALVARTAAVFPQGAMATSATVRIPGSVSGAGAVRLQPSHVGGWWAVAQLRGRPKVALRAAKDENFPLLSGAYYLEKALAPFAAPTRLDADTSLATTDVLFLLDAVDDPARVSAFVKGGGVLVVYADTPNLDAYADLLPIRLRAAPRELAGPLSWQGAQALGTAVKDTPLAGLVLPPDVKVTKQRLPEAGPEAVTRSWLTLADGTPLISGARQGEGTVVFVHVGAEASWSSLPLSGLYVEVLGRVLRLARGQNAAPPDGVLSPAHLVDAWTAPATYVGAQSLPAGTTAVSAAHPPGLYGPPATPYAHNLAPAQRKVVPLTDSRLRGLGTTLYGDTPTRVDLRPFLFGLGLVIALVDTLLRVKALAVLLLVLLPLTARAEPFPPAAYNVQLGWISSGDPEVDDITARGLDGLSTVLRARTTVEPESPVRVTPSTDDLGLYPILYWSITPATSLPDAKGAAALRAYLEKGGLLVIDGRTARGDAPQRTQAVLNAVVPVALTRLPDDHVLQRAYYLLRGRMPGRLEQAPVWIENRSLPSLLVGKHDWAGAWAFTPAGRPMFPLVPGGEIQRELAYRFGVNLVMYALLGDYKSDQLHVDTLLQQLGGGKP